MLRVYAIDFMHPPAEDELQGCASDGEGMARINGFTVCHGMRFNAKEDDHEKFFLVILLVLVSVIVLIFGLLNRQLAF